MKSRSNLTSPEATSILMQSKCYIKIEEPKIINKRILLSKIIISKNLKKYFQTCYLWVKYDVDIHEVPASILQIPVLSNVIMVAWATGADIYVGETDNTFLESLERIKSEICEYYPHFPYSTRIFADHVVTNSFSSQKFGLLFSGGIDSTSSYLKNRARKPNLIVIWGADIPCNREDFWARFKNFCIKFAQTEAVELNFIKTNMREFLDEAILDICFRRYLDGPWWGSLQFPVSTAGISAPLTKVKSIGTLLMAAGIITNYKDFAHTNFFRNPGRSSNFMQNNFRWADLMFPYDNVELTRHEKVRIFLKPEYNSERQKLILRVCHCQFNSFNCNQCEKCVRSILSLALEEMDPNKCGFHIDKTYFPTLKQQLIRNNKSLISLESDLFMWHDIQKYIPEKITHNLHNSKEFFKWYRIFDFSKIEIQPYSLPSILWHLGLLYSRFPKPIHKLGKTLFLHLIKQLKLH